MSKRLENPDYDESSEEEDESGEPEGESEGEDDHEDLKINKIVACKSMTLREW